MEPDDLLNFVELSSFTGTWDELGLPEEELGELQLRIIANPKIHPVMRGTDGLRKMRYAPSASNSGKRGALRVCYVYFERFHTVLLVVVYSKSERDNMPEAAKKRINRAIGRIEKSLERIFGASA